MKLRLIISQAVENDSVLLLICILYTLIDPLLLEIAKWFLKTTASSLTGA